MGFKVEDKGYLFIRCQDIHDLEIRVEYWQFRVWVYDWELYSVGFEVSGLEIRI